MEGQPDQSTPQPGWQFKPDGGIETTPAPLAEAARPAQPQHAVEWTASEYIAHQKSFGWYGLLAVGSAVFAVLVYWLTRDWISSVVVIILATAFGILGARRPRVLQYSVDQDGVHVENKFYPFNLFKSFSVINEGALRSILFMPLKRFMPALSIYYSPEDEAKILNLLSNFLPVENRERDVIDRLMHKVRF